MSQFDKETAMVLVQLLCNPNTGAVKNQFRENFSTEERNYIERTHKHYFPHV